MDCGHVGYFSDQRVIHCLFKILAFHYFSLQKWSISYLYKFTATLTPTLVNSLATLMATFPTFFQSTAFVLGPRTGITPPRNGRKSRATEESFRVTEERFRVTEERFLVTLN